MAVHKIELTDFFEDEQFTLIGIHCSIDDYRLAFCLNTQLNIKLKRCKEDIKHSNNATYTLFEWEDIKQQQFWFLASNKSVVIQKQKERKLNSLFQNQEITSKAFFLVPEYKAVNYTLKIGTKLSKIQTQNIINNILKIPQITTAYAVDLNTIKQKDNLIYN